MNQLKGIWKRESGAGHIIALSPSSLERDGGKDGRVLRDQLPSVLYVLSEYFTPSISLGENHHSLNIFQKDVRDAKTDETTSSTLHDVKGDLISRGLH